jgi:hypothetical protein
MEVSVEWGLEHATTITTTNSKSSNGTNGTNETNETRELAREKQPMPTAY